jgi:hypothetical protein
LFSLLLSVIIQVASLAFVAVFEPVKRHASDVTIHANHDV